MNGSGRAARRIAPVVLAVFVLGSLLIGPSVRPTSAHIGESAFASIVEPIGVAATPGRLLVTHPFCGNPREVKSIDSNGNVSLFATLPPLASGCREEYIAVAGPADLTKPGFPSPTKGGFPSNYAYVTQGPNILQVSTSGVVTAFATIPAPPVGNPACPGSHAGITFDRVGSFGYNMIVTCSSGTVWKVDKNGNATFVASVATFEETASVQIENPDVAPYGFGTYGGFLFVASETTGNIYAISPSGVVSRPVMGLTAPEGVNFIASNKCNFGSSGGTFFTAIFQSGGGSIYRFPLSAFAGMSGTALITSESGGIIRLTTPTTTVFFNEPIGEHEGSTFVDCTVPLVLQIDVKPGSPDHPINPRSQGTTPVAILSSPTFNAVTSTVISSIRFGVAGTENSIAFCNTNGEDVNGDGRLDLVCHATTTKLGITTPSIYRGPLILKMFYNAPGGDPGGEGFD